MLNTPRARARACAFVWSPCPHANCTISRRRAAAAAGTCTSCVRAGNRRGAARRGRPRASGLGGPSPMERVDVPGYSWARLTCYVNVSHASRRGPPPLQEAPPLCDRCVLRGRQRQDVARSCEACAGESRGKVLAWRLKMGARGRVLRERHPRPCRGHMSGRRRGSTNEQALQMRVTRAVHAVNHMEKTYARHAARRQRTYGPGGIFGASARRARGLRGACGAFGDQRRVQANRLARLQGCDSHCIGSFQRPCRRIRGVDSPHQPSFSIRRRPRGGPRISDL